MMKFAVAVLAALALVPSVAEDKPNSRATPNSFVAHSSTGHHVYGSPIGPAILGRGKTSHHTHVPKKRSNRQ